MSKQEKRANLYDTLMSDENIYLAIYSLESYIFNKELLDEKNRKLLNELRDKFNESTINEEIQRVREILEKLICEHDFFIKAKVYFKPKKYEEGKIVFRPLHIADITELIALVSMLNMFIYEIPYGENPLTLSNISRLIPGNFYGNRVSLRPEVLFKPWMPQYKGYTQQANKRFGLYHETKEYRYEVDLDLKNFFPSVNPQFLYHYIMSLLPITIQGGDLELYKKMLIKLLVCEIENLDAKTEELYYEGEESNYGRCWSRGIPQGLPQSYFFGNICMMEIAKIFGRTFPGESLYYVDDSVIFTNNIQDAEDFQRKLEDINEKVKIIVDSYLMNSKDEFFRLYNEELIMFTRAQEASESYKIEVHSTGGKSSYTEIAGVSEGEIYLKELSREVSLIGEDMFSIESDQESDNLSAKIEVLLEGIQQEKKITDAWIKQLSRNEKEESTEGIIKKEKYKKYKEKLERYYKFFKYRKLKLEIQRNDEFSDHKELEVSVKSKNFLEKFTEVYKDDIWSAYMFCGLRDKSNEEAWKQKKAYVEQVEQILEKEVSVKASYLHCVFTEFFNKQEEFLPEDDPYRSIALSVQKKYRKYEGAQRQLVYRIIKNKVMMYSWENLIAETGLFSEKMQRRIAVVDHSTCEIRRMILNAIYSFLLQVEISDHMLIMKKTKITLTYGELRLLVFLRSRWFEEEYYKKFHLNLEAESNLLKIDYSIMEVLETFAAYVKHSVLVDKLILIHQYTCDVWKNGSKYLYFYTLHNQEHAVDLIKNIIKVIKAIDFLQISANDYYVLFIACYLHDISMVKIPSLDSFLRNEEKADLIGSEFINEVRGNVQDDLLSIKNLLVQFYKKIDEFFENEVRNNHAKDSANEIRTREDLDFLEECLREVVASIAEAHGYRVEDVYNIKSDAKTHLISMKFDKILLRIADLLDMSSYRVSKPILNHNIEQMSTISAFHWISHLLTRGYWLETRYYIEDDRDKRHSVLVPGKMKEEVILHIDVAMSQMSQIINKEKCKNGAIDPSSITLQGFTIQCGEQCRNEQCNFLCKWFAKKNGYLLEEFAALKAYLNRVPTNFYKSNLKIELHIVDKTKLDAKQFEILEKNLHDDM